MFKRTKSPFSSSSESHPRNPPRGHRQSGIPSINRSRGVGVSNESDTPRTAGKSSVTKTAYQLSPPASSHRRVASMPQPLSSAIQAQMDIDADRMAKGLVSPPIVDFTRFDDQYRGPRSGNFEGLITKTKQTNRRSGTIKPILKRNPLSLRKNNPVEVILDDPHPASTRKPDPRLIVSTLELVVLDSQKKPADVLDVYDLLGMHQLDQLDFEELEIARANTSQAHPSGELVVLGEALRKTSIYASMTMVLGGREHELPIIVVGCIEELYRTGIYQPNLFRTLPNRSRLLELINIFDSEQQPPGSIIRSRHSLPPKSPVKSGFGANTSLHLESTPDICALLSTYLSALPEPILLPALFRPIWDWCGLENAEMDRLQSKPFQRRISSVPLLRTYTNTTESTPILIAQLVLHLLPSPHFSLLVYMLAFFSQVALVHEENGVGMEDLARMFGGRIFGGGQSRRRKLSDEIAKGDAHEPRTEGEVMMCWFLRRWGPISESLFDVIEDAKMGVLQDQQQDRLRSLQKRCAVSVDNAGIPNHSSGRDTPFRLPVQDDVLCSGESPPRLKHDEEEEGRVKDYASPAGDDSFNIPTADGESVYSATALDERLLDVSISTLLDQTFSIESLDDDASRSILPPTIPKPEEEDKTCHRILALEAELEKSNKAVTESVHELSKEKQSRLDLENRVGELEMALRMERKKKGGGVDLDGDEGAAAVLKKERDDALDLVREIRKLML